MLHDLQRGCIKGLLKHELFMHVIMQEVVDSTLALDLSRVFDRVDWWSVPMTAQNV